jgi:hypothetical protein
MRLTHSQTSSPGASRLSRCKAQCPHHRDGRDEPGHDDSVRAERALYVLLSTEPTTVPFGSFASLLFIVYGRAVSGNDPANTIAKVWSLNALNYPKAAEVRIRQR